MYTYIKYNIPSKYVEFAEMLDSTLYNNIGTTYNDYMEGRWVLLSNEQLIFKTENPNASVKEVFDMKMSPKFERTIDQAKVEMKNRITEYDNSNEVNAFYISGLEVWLDKATRTGLKLRFEAEMAMGQTETTLWYNNMQFPLTVENAIKMLYAIELYASACYDNTQSNIAIVEELTTVEEVDGFDYTIGYPNKLEF